MGTFLERAWKSIGQTREITPEHIEQTPISLAGRFKAAHEASSRSEDVPFTLSMILAHLPAVWELLVKDNGELDSYHPNKHAKSWRNNNPNFRNS